MLSSSFIIKSNFPGADFWVMRKGDASKVGSPTRTFSKENIGIKVKATDVIDPSYLFYVFMHLQNQGFFEKRAQGSLPYSHITNSDVKAAIGTLVPVRENPPRKKASKKKASKKKASKKKASKKRGEGFLLGAEQFGLDEYGEPISEREVSIPTGARKETIIQGIPIEEIQTRAPKTEFGIVEVREDCSVGPYARPFEPRLVIEWGKDFPPGFREEKYDEMIRFARDFFVSRGLLPCTTEFEKLVPPAEGFPTRKEGWGTDDFFTMDSREDKIARDEKGFTRAKKKWPWSVPTPMTATRRNPSHDDDDDAQKVCDIVNSIPMYRGSRAGLPYDLPSGPVYLISDAGMAGSYGKTGEFRLNLENPEIVFPPGGWVGVFDDISLGLDPSPAIDLLDEGYDSVIYVQEGFKGPIYTVLVLDFYDDDTIIPVFSK